MRGKNDIAQNGTHRRKNKSRGFGLLGSVGAFLGMVALSLVLLVPSVNVDTWLAYITSQGGVVQVLSSLVDGSDSSVTAAGSDGSQSQSHSGQDSDAGTSSDSSVLQDSDSASAEISTPLNLSGYYYYDQLDSADQKKYELMYRALALREKVEFPSFNSADLDRFHKYVNADHPEVFYSDGFTVTTNSQSGVSVLNADDLYTKDQIDRYNVQLDEVVKQIESGIPANADDYTKAKVVFEYLAENVTYNHEVANQVMGDSVSPDQAGQTVVNALIDHSCVCNGYAQSFELVMHDLGIPCVLVTGELNDSHGPHAWNLVQLDGEWYYVDPTWGDPDANDNYVPGESPSTIRYAYLGATTADMLASRSFEGWQILPDCTATADNYYVREGRELQSADIDQIVSWGNDAVSQGEREFSFQCGDQQVYSEVLQAFQSGAVSFAVGSGYQYSFADDVRAFTVVVG